LMFGETHYIGVEGRAVAAAVDADAVEARVLDDASEPDWHLLEKGQLDITSFFERLEQRAPAILGKPLDLEAAGRFWRSTSRGVHWMVVHEMRDLKARGVRVALLTNNVKEFGDAWRAMFPIEELCEEVVDSSHVGMRKPEPGIYELICTRMKIAAADA